DGEWLVDPFKVKNEFLNHFASHFSKPKNFQIKLGTDFPNRLSLDQLEDLELIVTYDEIKRNILGKDVVAAVTQFFSSGEKSLKYQFPRLYALEKCKLIMVAEKMRHDGLSSSYRRPLRGGAEEDQQSLLQAHVTDLVLPQMLDRLTWSLDSSGDFLVKSVRNLIDDYILPSKDVPTRWVKVIPIKINIFAWRVFLDKLPTRLDLSLRGVDISEIIKIPIS
ncbi:hypothetical protein Tco_0140476, partial [Tanacetum coccineum]